MLPRLRASVGKMQQETVAMGGINYSDQFREGDLRDSLNLSARRWPYLTTRRGRSRLEGYQDTTALTAWGKLVAVQGTTLSYDGHAVGTVTAGEKQFAVVNTKMVIWPDKKILNMTTGKLTNMYAQFGSSGQFVFTKNSVKAPATGTPNGLLDFFSVGDGVAISGLKKLTGNNKTVVITALTADTLTTVDGTFAEGTETGSANNLIRIERKIPDMDFICESENRLWGCCSETQTIYASRPGDPTNFFVYEGTADDSYALAVGSDGDFTGCCKLGSSVLFWKENKLHKLLGSTPVEYSMYTYEIEGLQAGCHKSMQVLNEVLFYVGAHGVYAYTGGTPSLISANFGAMAFTKAVAGNDGDSYYLSAEDEAGGKHLFVYETREGIWVREDSAQAVDFARLGRELYFADRDGLVWRIDAGADTKEQPWLAQFTPFYETIQGRKKYSRLLLRVELPKGSWLVAETRRDGGEWQECGKATGRENDVVSLRLPPNRCDKFELRLRGKGPCTILSVMREFMLGSER